MNNSTSFLLHKLVFILDRAADKMLRAEFGISYKRALFLVMIEQGPMTQHQLALTLGYTDPAVSAMLVELMRENYVIVQTSAKHGRLHIVRLTPTGEKLVSEMQKFLDVRFEQALHSAGIDTTAYQEMTNKIYELVAKKDTRNG